MSLPSGNDSHSELENHHFLMGKLTISMVIFHSYLKLPQGIYNIYGSVLTYCTTIWIYKIIGQI